MDIELRINDSSVVRDQGLVPGILYGHNIDPTNIKVNYKELVHNYHENGLTMSFQANLEETSHVVFFKEIQKDPLNPNSILHFDLMKVSEEDIMTASIPVHLNGKSEVEKKGLVVQLVSDRIDYEFPVSKGISHVDIDISSLEDGDSILAAAIDVPEGYILHDEPNKIVVNVTHPKLINEDTTEEVIEELPDTETEEK